MIKRLRKLCCRNKTPKPPTNQDQPGKSLSAEPQNPNSSKSYEKRNGEIAIARRINTEASKLQA